MSKHLERELNYLNKELMSIAAMVENATEKALTALVERREELAREVIEEDYLINDKEVKIEEECLKILALHQPVAVDLRFVITVLKINNDLERVGDLAVNIAERAVYLAAKEMLTVTLNFPKMAAGVKEMLQGSLDALTSRDTDLARRVIAMDDAIDDANREMYLALRRLMRDNPATINRALHLVSASRHLERIADLATNIAEDVIYMVEGEVVRHKAANFLKLEDKE
ncbi:MAG: phosphate signaling complex protein PhoU [Deltaproteobacteria bacterium]|nr:phosphate signaling complex protein PhoU [Candidatus Anaeroferrophillus wilburensis]MBN2887887.1 phosphate signaling complex protein PhoU [Deltaproteobacteria bacterium]